MESDVALEIDVRDLLKRNPIGLEDWMELRREIYRTRTSRDSFLRILDEDYPEDSPDSLTLWKRAIGLCAAGATRQAQHLLKDSSDPLASYLQGQMALERDDATEARRLLEPISGDGQPEAYRICFADALARLEDLETLEALTASLREMNEHGTGAAYVSGLLAEGNGDYEEAVACYERCLAIDSDHKNARFRLAYRLDLMGRDEESLGHYERLKQVFPVPVGVLLNLGVIYEDAEKYDKAISCYNLVLAHDHNHTIARMFHEDAERSLDMFYDEEKEKKEDKRNQIMKIPVTDFELSVRSRNCLARMNLNSLGDLVRKSEAELLSFKNFGETSLNEIKEVLRSKGLRLGMPLDEDDRRGMRDIGGIDRDSIRSKSCAELDFSVRSRKALSTLGVSTVGQLIDLSESQILACKNFGHTSLVEIKKKLSELNLSLRG